MRLLLDESVTWNLRPLLMGEHEVWTAQYLGWGGRRNGEILALARSDFDVLITADQGIPDEQNITEMDVAVIVLAAKTNAIGDLRPLIPQVLEALHDVKRGEVIHIEAP
jgi:predicted nuclease of predicted toxin-antitoxin system